MPTIFTKIIQNKIPSYKILENDTYCAFLDVNPLKRGHTLVVPKKEIDDIFDLDDRILAGLHVFAKKVASAIKKTFPCNRIGTLVVGLDVPHAHLHLVPINRVNDINITKPKLNLSEEEFSEIAQRIKEHI